MALAAIALCAPRFALAQSAPSGGNPGQFGGGAPGQFDPNAIPGSGAAPPGAAAPGAALGTPAPSPFGGMNAGGLTPPPPATEADGGSGATPPSDTDATLDAAKEEDSGRGLTWFWLEAGGGLEHIGLATIDSSSDSACEGQSGGCIAGAGEEPPSLAFTSGMVEGGLGARLLFFTVGARGRLGFFDGFDLARVGGELGVRIPIGIIEPRINVGGGYAVLMNVSSPLEGADLTENGYYARLGGGLDLFLANNFALGGDVTGDLIGLGRDIQTVQGDAGPVTIPGRSSVGLGVAIGLHAGLHL